MELEYEVSSLDPLAENIRGLYTKKADDTGYVLSVKGVVPKSKVDEFRTTNVELQKQLDKYKDVDPEKYAIYLDQAKKLEEGELIKKGDFDTLVAGRVKGLKAEYDQKINDLSGNLTVANRQLEVLLIDNAIKGAAMTMGVLPTAIDDVVLRGKVKFQIVDGQPVAKDEKGQIVYSTDGVTPLGVAEWAKTLKTTAPHLFAGVQGSGAGGGGGNGGRGQQQQQPGGAVNKIARGLAAQST